MALLRPAADGVAPAAPAADGTAPAAPAAQAAATVIAPTFDVVRVESNGSIVVAGNAAPNARVEILNGSTVLGSTVAGTDGAFVIVLDDPLKPGDYTILLRSTTPGNAVIASAQTAVVSVPANPSGQVLAMVEEPGKPSELLTVPEPATKPSAPAADNQPAASAAGDQAVASTVGDQAAASATATEAPAAAPAPAATAPAVVQAAPAPATPPAIAATEPKIVVEAVEIDGKKIFVAGLADPGRKVRAYANDMLLGDAQTSPDGHFLVEATRDIPVGSYTIHVDGLDADGVKVVARAAVPFEREPGELVAAVAPAEPKPEGPKPEAPATAEAEAPAASASEPATADATAPAVGAPAVAAAPAETAPAATPVPAAEAPAGAAAATPPAQVSETVAPKLEQADGAVIIRRNDTLWRISRRVYGHGMRYSTIYLANQDQISDPDRIWPGQVFKVPQKSKEGESADLKAMGDQMTKSPAKAN